MGEGDVNETPPTTDPSFDRQVICATTPFQLLFGLPVGKPIMPAQVARRLFTVEEYHRMGEGGILAVNEHLELIEGEILKRSPITSRHAACVMRSNATFSNVLGDFAIISVHNPVVLNEFSEPEPDLAILKRRDDFYSQFHPGPADIFLVIEIAETSVAYEREVKLPVYASSGVQEVWLADIPAETVTAHTEPANGVYRAVRSYQRGDSITPVHFPDLSIEVVSILG